MVIFENPILFGLTFSLIGLTVLAYLTMTTFNLKKAIRRRKEWRIEWAKRVARGETMVGWADKRKK
jgi:hypothetical protein